MLKKPTDNEIKALCNADLLAIDIETKDPLLVKKGPGTHRGDGFICGVAVGMSENNTELNFYLPLTHPDISSEERETNEKIVSDLTNSKTAKVGANIMYDIEWLEHSGFTFDKSTIHDVQYAEPLLDEYARSYSLNSLAKKYTTEVKKTSVLQEYNDIMGWKGKPIEYADREILFQLKQGYATQDIQDLLMKYNAVFRACSTF